MRRTAILVGLDIGTTNVKAVAHRVDGTRVAGGTAPLTSLRPRDGWEQYPIASIDSAVNLALREMVAGLERPDEIVAIAVASMGETAVALDDRLEPVYDALAWHDARGTEQATAFHRLVGTGRIYAITGLPPRRIFGLYKMLWMRENMPESFDRIRHWLNVSDYVSFRLSGEMATDLSLASRFSLLDIRAKELSQELLTAAGLDRRIFAEVVQSGTRLGTISREASMATGLPRSAVVSAGGHDHPCGALGAGVVRPGDLLDSIGTAESVFSIVHRPVLDESMAETGFEQGVHVVGGMHYAMGGVYTSGASVEWATRLLGLAGPTRFADFARLAREAPPGSRGAIFLPYLRLAGPPVNDDRARAALVGLSDVHGPAEIARAVIEGISYEFIASMRAMEDTFAFAVRRIIVIGGGSANMLGLAIKRGLSGIEVKQSTSSEAGALGAAMLAGLGSGEFTSLNEAIVSMRIELQDATLEVDGVGIHEEMMEIYARVHPGLRAVHHSISALQRDEVQEESV